MVKKIYCCDMCEKQFNERSEIHCCSSDDFEIWSDFIRCLVVNDYLFDFLEPLKKQKLIVCAKCYKKIKAYINDNKGGDQMTYAKLYHLNDKCNKVEKMIKTTDVYIDEEGNVTLNMTAVMYEDLKEILRDCQYLIYDLCQREVILK